MNGACDERQFRSKRPGSSIKDWMIVQHSIVMNDATLGDHSGFDRRHSLGVVAFHLIECLVEALMLLMCPKVRGGLLCLEVSDEFHGTRRRHRSWATVDTDATTARLEEMGQLTMNRASPSRLSLRTRTLRWTAFSGGSRTRAHVSWVSSTLRSS